MDGDEFHRRVALSPTLRRRRRGFDGYKGARDRTCAPLLRNHAAVGPGPAAEGALRRSSFHPRPVPPRALQSPPLKRDSRGARNGPSQYHCPEIERGGYLSSSRRAVPRAIAAVSQRPACHGQAHDSFREFVTRWKSPRGLQRCRPRFRCPVVTGEPAMARLMMKVLPRHHLPSGICAHDVRLIAL
jgi:hypothetical protein